MNPAESLRRVWYLLHRRRLEAELEREMEAHREMMAEADGEPRPFGSALRLREQARDVWGWNWLDTALQDLRYARRTLSPGIAVTAGLILSLGIGLNLTFFQIVNVMLLDPPAVTDPHTLVRFHRHTKNSRSSGVFWEETDFVRRNNSVLAAVLIQNQDNLAWGDDASDRVRVSFVSSNWFEQLGYGAALGRVLFEDADGRPGAPAAIIVSHDFWQTRLGGDPGAVGRIVRLNNRPATLVGVASANFPDMRNSVSDAWVPFEQRDYFFPGADSSKTVVDMYARLRPGISPAAAREALKAPMAAMPRAQAEASVEGPPWLEPHSGAARFRTPRDNAEMWGVVVLVTAITLLVLCVACANVGNLVLSRAIGRSREFSVRTALGASRWRIMRQILIESLLLGSIGAAGGLVLTAWAARTLAAALALPPFLNFQPDARLALAAAGAACLAMLGTGLAPAWRVSRQDLSAAMKDGGQQSSGGLDRTRLRKLLVAAQVAGCCLLLAVAGMMIRGLQRLLLSDPGFDFHNVATLNPSLSRYGIKGDAARAWWEPVRRAIASHPETASALIVSHAPLGQSLNESRYNDAPRITITSMGVEPGFFALMKVPLLAGRDFLPADDPRVALIISRRVAMEMYGTLDVVGRGFPKSVSKEQARQIVGVAGDAHMIKIAANDVGEMYSPLRVEGYEDYQLIVRARTDAGRLIGPIRQAARAADDRVLAQAALMRAEFDRKLRPMRLASSIAALTGGLALALACLGVYGVVSFGAALRTKEIGIRLALGASRPALLLLLVRQQAMPFLGGAVIGIAGAVPLGIGLAHEPFYLNPADPLVQAGVLILFALTGGLAALAPGLRATGLDPLRGLRHD